MQDVLPVQKDLSSSWCVWLPEHSLSTGLLCVGACLNKKRNTQVKRLGVSIPRRQNHPAIEVGVIRKYAGHGGNEKHPE